MNKHSKSLLLSIIIHSLLVASVFYAYSEVVTSKGEKKEKRVCIHLGCITQSANTEQKPKKIHKQEKKISTTTKTHLHKKRKKPKEIVKKVPQKTIPIQKEKPIEQKQPKVVEEKVVQSKKCPEKKIAEICPHEVQHTQTPQQPNQQQESTQSQYMNQHLTRIVKLLQENLYYPRRARKRGIEGEVVVKFTLQTDAKVTDIKIISSQSDVLSRGAKKTLQNLSGEFPKPDEELTLTVPISYSLH